MKIKKTFALLSVLITTVATAQEFTDPNLQSLVDAERAFAQMAEDKNTRDAFLYFFSDSAVTSAPGIGPRAGKKHLEAQQPNESWLDWEPVYTDIAASGDFGYNTGPWEFHPAKNEKAVAFGEFVSIWKKNEKGEWKVAVDIGIRHGEPKGTPSLTTSSIKLRLRKSKERDADGLFTTEKNFISDYSRNGSSAYKTRLSDEARFYRPDQLPHITQEEIQQLLTESRSKVKYEFVDGDLASSGDLAYVYGKVSYDMVKDGIAKTRHSSYMRFWKKEDGRNWKIVLDLISD